MTDQDGESREREVRQWLRAELDAAVQKLGAAGVFDGALIEVRPVWTRASEFLIGKAREQGDMSTFRWFICGAVPLDSVPADAAATPREAARHFAMKWQLDATRLQGEAAAERVRLAERLYLLTDDDRLWSD